MPQLDLGIFYVEFFLNFIYFWLIYLFLSKNIFPFLNKSIKIRKYKIKKINIFLNFYGSNFSYLNLNLKNIKFFIDFFLFLNIKSLFSKLNFFIFLFFKHYNSIFIYNTNLVLKNKLNTFLFINKI